MADDRAQLEQHLSSLVAEFGRRLLRDPRQVAASAGDVAPGHRAERRALEAAAEAGVADALLDLSDDGLLPEDRRAPVAQRLADAADLPTELAAWAVDAFAHALQLSAGADSAPRQILPGGCVVADSDPTTPAPGKTPPPPDWAGTAGGLADERTQGGAERTRPRPDSGGDGGRGPGANDGDRPSPEKWRTRHRKALLGAGSLTAALMLVLAVLTGARSWEARTVAATGEELVPDATCEGERTKDYEGWVADCRTTVDGREVQVIVPVEAIEEADDTTSSGRGSPTTAERDCAAGNLPLDPASERAYEVEGTASFGRITCSFWDFESGRFLFVDLYVEGVGGSLARRAPVRLVSFGGELDDFPEYAPLWQEVVDRVVARVS